MVPPCNTILFQFVRGLKGCNFRCWYQPDMPGRSDDVR